MIKFKFYSFNKFFSICNNSSIFIKFIDIIIIITIIIINQQNSSLVQCQNWLIDYLLPSDYNHTISPPLPASSGNGEDNDHILVTASLTLYRFHVPFEEEVNLNLIK